MARRLGIVYSDGKRGPQGEVRNPSWSPDGKTLVYYRIDVKNRAQYTKLYSWDKKREYRYTDVFPTVCPKNGRMALTDLDFPFGNPTASISVMNVDGTQRVKIFQRQDGASLMPTWSPDCQWVAFGFGVFFGGRGFAPANVFMVKADGSESRQVTQSKVNAGFPAWHPDGKTLIYRVWGTQDNPETRGLRALNLADNSVKTLTTGWDNFPFISPSGDRVVFTRRMPDFDFEVFTMKPDGSDVKRLTTTSGADAHATWTADGKRDLVRELAHRIQGRGRAVRRLAAALCAGVPDGPRRRQRAAAHRQQVGRLDGHLRGHALSPGHPDRPQALPGSLTDQGSTRRRPSSTRRTMKSLYRSASSSASDVLRAPAAGSSPAPRRRTRTCR